jgi:protein-disulfide isomerase
VEESKEPGQEGSQEVPPPSGIEETKLEASQETPATGELLSAEQPETAPVAAVPPRPAVATPSVLRGPVALAAAVAIVAFAGVGIFVLGMFTHSKVDSNGGGGGGQAVVGAQPTAGPAPTVGPVDVSVDNDPAEGSADAKVTVIEFSDFQCPYCARFQADTLPQIMQNYGDKIRFVYRDFPLTSLHQYALKAAEASECANEQGKYWDYHNLLFQNQSALDDASLKNYAATLQLDTATFNQCLDSDKYMSEVQKDYQDGIAAGVQGTPAFFINGMLVSGAQPYTVFKAAIDQALAKAGG